MIFILITLIVVIIGIVVTINALRNCHNYDEINKDIYEKNIKERDKKDT